MLQNVWLALGLRGMPDQFLLLQSNSAVLLCIGSQTVCHAL